MKGNDADASIHLEFPPAFLLNALSSTACRYIATAHRRQGRADAGRVQVRDTLGG